MSKWIPRRRPSGPDSAVRQSSPATGSPGNPARRRRLAAAMPAPRLVSGRILISPPPDAARRKGTQRLRCSMGRCSRRGSLKAAFRRWYQNAPFTALVVVLPLLVSGCGGGDSTQNTLTASNTDKASSSALSVFDLSGHPVDPFAAPGAKATVFIFISTDCPISNRYAPEIRRFEE